MSRSLSSTLGALGLALLNATLLLALAVAVMAWLALGRLDALSERTLGAVSAALAPQGARLERIAVAVEGIEARLDDPALAEGLRAEVAGLSAELARTREALAEARDAAPRALAATTLAAMRGLLPEPEAR
jgi:hypothetical protein